MFRISALAFISIVAFANLALAQRTESGSEAKTIEKSWKVLFVGNDPDAEFTARSYMTGKSAERYAELKKERTPAFKALLESHFENVKVLKADDYSAEMSKSFDVTVFDAMPPAIETVDMGNWKKQIRMPFDFDRPAVMIGNVGPLTLGRNAIGLRLDHL